MTPSPLMRLCDAAAGGIAALPTQARIALFVASLQLALLSSAILSWDLASPQGGLLMALPLLLGAGMAGVSAYCRLMARSLDTDLSFDQARATMAKILAYLLIEDGELDNRGPHRLNLKARFIFGTASGFPTHHDLADPTYGHRLRQAQTLAAREVFGASWWKRQAFFKDLALHPPQDLMLPTFSAHAQISMRALLARHRFRHTPAPALFR